MASISTDKAGLRRIQFVAGNGQRRTIRLGRTPMKLVREIKTKVETLSAAQAAGLPLDRETAAWVARVDDELARKLAAVGLIPERLKALTMTVGGLIDHVQALRADAKPRTLTNLKQAGAKFVEHFGRDHPLDRITPGDADGFVAAIRQVYSPAYVARLIKYGKQFFHAARRAGLVEKSPFDGVKAGTMANPERMYFLTHDDAQKILAACPDAEWRVIVALARYGGLRCPSEVVALTWADVDWERRRFLVKSPKTAHHADGGRRWVPLFPELRAHLETAFDQAEPGAMYVVGRGRSHDTNLRTALERIIYRAGLLPWPKLFQNMRASRETELAQTFPLHVVTAWIGNSARVAAKHYLQVTDADFVRATAETLKGHLPSAPPGAPAAQNPAQPEAVRSCQEGTVVPSEEQNHRGISGTPKNPGDLRLDQYARQDSNL